jgi:hypothetical protein
MVARRIVGIILVLAGIAMLVSSHIITVRVAEGSMQISSAQGQVDQANQLFSLNPYSKQAGKVVTGSAQNQINEGRHTVAYYEGLARTLQIAGIVSIIVGVGVFFIGGGKKRSH